MDSHTISALTRLEVVETGRRRRLSEEEKARIVLESLSEPRLVAATARRYGLSRSLLVTWRRAFAAERTKSEADFVRAVVAEGGPVASVAPSSENATAHSYASGQHPGQSRRSAAAPQAAAALGCWVAFQFHGSRSATLLTG
ncbi:transposase [Bradyrhizobium elkanii]|uniref:transposase n=1 Tax=Bradyrhizobium elkanii TaxID=29448 RepID=UPI00216A7859|nr:transposase [Bradyrhizobium elkanii]WLC12551.1 transposase [Bradyrhizobium elkanii USDA 94]WLC12738.1 transposase [Bradyrhizobium elkanii USDA 94]